MLRGNVAVLEQLCCSAAGSVSGYRGGEVLREPDPRAQNQIDLTRTVQDGARHFANQAIELAAHYGLRPFDDLDRLADNCAAVLARLLVMPTDDELVLLSGLRHDVNFGSTTTLSMFDPKAIETLKIAAALPEVCVAHDQPKWLGGSLAGVAPVYSYLYALFGAGLLAPDVFADVKCANIDVRLIMKAQTRTVRVSCFRSGFADLRIVVPLQQQWNVTDLGIQIDRLAMQGLLHGVTVQFGASVKQAISNREVLRLPEEAIAFSGAERCGPYFHCKDEAAPMLLIRLPRIEQKIAIVCLSLTPLGGQRPLALSSADEPG
jgi:hypothetical protein